jgi:t-SNARE complex subunit (syntaxin)
VDQAREEARSVASKVMSHLSRGNLEELQRRNEREMTEHGVKETVTDIFSSVSHTQKQQKENCDMILKKIIKKRPETEGGSV